MSAKFFPMNLAKFKRVSSDKNTTTLRHDDGHEIKVAHSALSPKLRGHLASLPEHKESNAPKASAKTKMMADGGDVKQSNDPAASYVRGSDYGTEGTYSKEESEASNNPTPEAKGAYSPGNKDAVDFVKGATNQYAQGGKVSGPMNPKLAESKKVPMYAEGTPDAPVQDPNDVTAQAEAAGQGAVPNPLQSTDQTPGIDPSLARKRQLYNTIAPIPWQIDANGNTERLDPASWNRAEQLYGQETKAKSDQDMAATSQAMDENKARAAAGLPSISVPQGSSPMQAPPQDASPTAQTQSQAPDGQAPQGQTSAQSADPFGTQKTLETFQQGLGEAKQGIQGEAQALGAQGKAEAQALQQNIADRQQTQQNYQDHFNQLDQERQGFQQDLMNNHIDSKHYLNSRGTPGKISTAIGLILGGIGGGLTHQENPALKFLNQNIDRDINAQMADLGKKENLLSANMRQFGNLRDATDMTRIMQNDIVSMQLKRAAAEAQDPLAKSRAMQASGKLDMDTAGMQGQMAMRRTLLSGVNGPAGNADMAAKMINFALPPDQRKDANKELQDAQNAIALRDEVLNAYDKIAKINTLGNRALNPYQSKLQIDAIEGPVLDKMTKDTSGRVTPETVGLIRSVFKKIGADPQTVAIGRKSAQDLMTQNMHYPIMQSYGMNPMNWGKYGANGQSKIQFTPGLKGQ